MVGAQVCLCLLLALTICFSRHHQADSRVRICGGRCVGHSRGSARNKNWGSQATWGGLESDYSRPPAEAGHPPSCWADVCVQGWLRPADLAAQRHNLTEHVSLLHPLTSDFSRRFCTSTWATISFMLVSSTMPPITTSCRM